MLPTTPVTWAELSIFASCMIGAGASVAAVVLWMWRVVAGIKKDLTDHRVALAEKYVTQTALDLVESRISEAIREMGKQFERSVDRLFHLIMPSSHPRPPDHNG